MCFDAHWLYRGASNSEVAVFDIARLYADRIIELHVRQSKDDVWTEVLGPCSTMTAEEAHRKSVEYARRIFEPLA
jgi:hypothetical protein